MSDSKGVFFTDHRQRFPKHLTLLTSLVVQQEVVGRWAAQQEKELKLLSRADGSKLFSNLTRGNHYLVQAEGYLNNSGSGQASEMALIWNRTLPGGSVSVALCFYKKLLNHINVFTTFVFVMKEVNDVLQQL